MWERTHHSTPRIQTQQQQQQQLQVNYAQLPTQWELRVFMLAYHRIDLTRKR